MSNKDFFKIINEELSDFDFLGNDAHLREEEDVDLLKNGDFQKQFIVDSLLNTDKINVEIKDSNVDGNWENNPDTESNLTIKYVIGIEYKFDKNKEPIKFELIFSCDNVIINATPEGESWVDTFNWDSIAVDLFSENGDEIKFKTFEKTPANIKKLFIREYIKDYIGDVTDTKSHTSKTKDKIQNISHF